MKAVEHKPDFDIALANLGNAIKDVVCMRSHHRLSLPDVELFQGRPWDAIEYYKRSAAANPNLPEAICGLANSLSSICDLFSSMIVQIDN